MKLLNQPLTQLLALVTITAMLGSPLVAQDDGQDQQQETEQQRDNARNGEANGEGQSDSGDSGDSGETDSQNQNADQSSQDQKNGSSNEPITFSFDDPKGVNAIGFFYNSELEPVVGIASGVKGEITYNPQKPDSFSGSISVDASTLQVANEKMTEDMLSSGWLNVEQFPRITFQFNEVTETQAGENDNAHSLTVSGELTLHGVSVEKTVPISATYYKDRAADRGRAESGDLLLLRSTFQVSRADFGIKPDMDNTKVGRKVAVVVGIAGYSPGE